MTRTTRRDAFGTFAPLQSPRRGQPSYRELAETRARHEAPELESEPDDSALSVPTAGEALVALILLAVAVAGVIVRWLLIH